jgi:predicted phosphoribosyltransferase
MALDRPVVLGLARGGVEVAAEVARSLEAPLDVEVVRKLGAPSQPELAVGAIARGEMVRNEQAIRAIGLSDEELESVWRAEDAELDRRDEAYRPARARVDVSGRDVVVVDDGVATGMTTTAALRSVRRRGARRVVLAVPVAPGDTLARLRLEADAVVCLETPSSFRAVGEFYEDFSQTTDAQVVSLLAASD